MQIFWETIIKPSLEKIQPKHIIEIGSQKGFNTQKILTFCDKNNCKLSTIDPFPLFDCKKLKDEYGEKFEYYNELSLNALAHIEPADVILIDGDHN